MLTGRDFREDLYELLDSRMSTDDLNLLCNIYLNIDYENVRGEIKSNKVAELIALMARQKKISLLCHKIIKMRPDLEKEILSLGCVINGPQPYFDIATDDFLPGYGIEHVLRDPRKIYLRLNCAAAPQGDPNEKDAIAYVDTVLQRKPAILIVGDYGTGKSFLTQKVFIKNTTAAANGQPDSRIPILLPLKQLVGLASRDKDLTLTKIVERLRMLRFFSDTARSPADEKAEVKERMREGEFLCILDGFDEIPLISILPDPRDELAGLVDSLAIGENRIVITSRPAILPGVLSPEFASIVRNIEVAYLLPWQADEMWFEYLMACRELGVDFGEQGWFGFGQSVLSRPELKQLTRTPLFCQMLVETRREIMRLGDFTLAKLYDTYVGRYFENVSERSPIRLRFDDLQKEIAYKKNCLMATAVGMAKSNTLALVQEEIEQALLHEAQEYDDNLLAEFTRQDVLIYSLLVGDVDYKFSFSHKSFYEFFVALKIYKELQSEEDRFALLGELLLTREIVSFLSGLLSFSSALRAELRQAFEHPYPLDYLNVPDDNKTLLRNLALTQLDLLQQFEGINLDDLNFNGYTLSSADRPMGLVRVNLNGCDLEGALLIHANLRGSSLRSAKLNRCNLDQADLREADLSGAELQDISCRDTRFSGANFTDAIVRPSDIRKILNALHAEREVFPNSLTDASITKTQNVLEKSVV